MNRFFAHFRILPLLVLVAMLAFAVRVGETVTGFRDLAASAMAADEKTQPKAEEPKTAAAEEKPADTAAETPNEEKPEISLPEATLPEVWADPANQDMADSPEQMRLLEDLAKRRQQLDAREKSLDTREALLKASEKQIDEKITEMTELKDQIEKLLGQQETEETNRIKSLVKIYEGMKAKDAADIFNQMDMGVLLQVISKMSERKSAPIIAAMDTARANELTVRLTEMQKLPEQQQFNGMGGPTPTSAPPGSAALPGLDALGQP